MSVLDDILTQTEPSVGRTPTPQDRISSILTQTQQPAADPAKAKGATAKLTEPQAHTAADQPPEWEQTGPTDWQVPSKEELTAAAMANNARGGRVGPMPAVPGKPATQPVAQPGKPGDFFVATMRSGVMGALQGIMSPAGSLMPNAWQRANVQQQDDQKTMQGYMSSADAPKLLVNASPAVKGVLTAAPRVAGELAGTLIPGEAIVKGTSALSKVASSSKAVQKVVSAVAGGTAFSAFSHVDDGESRIGKIAAMTLQQGAIETGLSLFSRANKEELGPAYARVVRKVAQRTGQSEDQVAQNLAMVRAGANVAPKDVETAEHVIQAAKDVPGATETPVVRNAQQRWEAMMEKVIPKNMHMDPLLAQANPNYGVKFTIYVDGQKTPGLDFSGGQKVPTQDYWHIPSDPNNPEFFSQQLGALRNKIGQAVQDGKDIRIDDVFMGYETTKTRFKNFLLGKQADGKPTKPPIPGAAPANSYAASGGEPPVGATVQVQPPGAAPQKRTVVSGNVPPSGTEAPTETPTPAAPQESWYSAALRKMMSAFTSEKTTGPIENPGRRIFFRKAAGLAAGAAGSSIPGSILPSAGEMGLLAKYPTIKAAYMNTLKGMAGKPYRTSVLSFLDDLQFMHRPEYNEAGTQGFRALGIDPEEFSRFQRDLQPFTEAQNAAEAADNAVFMARARARGAAQAADRHFGESIEPSAGEQSFGASHPPGERVAKAKFAPPGSVWTVDPATGKQELTPLSQIMVNLEHPGGALGATKDELLPHPDGSPRHAMVHVASTNPEEQISYEPWGMDKSPDVNSFRTAYFYHPDVDADFGHDPRLFIGPGRITISTTPGERIWTPSQFGPVGDFGPTDAVQALKAQSFKLRTGSQGKLQTGDVFAGQPDLEYAPFKPTAGFIPRRMQTEFGRPGEQISLPVAEDLRTVVPREPEEPISGAPSKGRTKRSQRTEWPGEGPEGVPESYGIGPDFIGHPEIMTGKKVAQILLTKGVSKDTPVYLRAAYDVHKDMPEGAQWTLSQLANYEPRLISLERLHDEATPRGIRVVPQGKGVTLSADDGSWTRKFDTQLEAADFVLRQPSGKIPGNKLEAPLEAQLGMGFERTFDADKDASLFLPNNLQEAATQELVQGKRPLITLYSTKPWQVEQAIRGIEIQSRLPQGSLATMQLPQMVGRGRNAVAVYSPQAVAQSIQALRPLLYRLGVYNANSTTEDVIRELSTKKWGLEAFANRPGMPGRNPADALYYTWMRERGMKEAWEQGSLAGDSLGMYRTYPPNVKAQSQFFFSGSGDETPPPTGKDLSDNMQAFPPDAHMYPPDAYPPMFEPEVNLPDEWTRPPEFKQEGGPLAKLGRFFRIPLELMKDWQTRTGVPYHTSMMEIEDARSTLEGHFGPFQDIMRNIFKGTTRDLREQATLLFEAKASGKGFDDLVKVSNPQAVQLASAAEVSFKRWLGETYGYSPEAVDDFFGQFPQVRAANGNFLDYSRGRGRLPELMTLVSKQFRRGEIKSDGREMDLYRTMMRVGRAISNEKDLAPTWNVVKERLAAFQNAGAVSQDNMNYFYKYMSEVVHVPDTVAVTLARVTNQVSEMLAGKKIISDPEAFDLVKTVTGANYFANMAWNPGLVLRNMLQTLQTSSGLGMKAWANGVKMVSKWRNDPAFEEELIRRGILTRDVQSQQFADVSEAMSDIQAAMSTKLGKAGKAFEAYHDYGTKWYKSADDMNRIIAYYAQHSVALDAGKDYLDGKIDFQGYLKKSMADMRGPAGGPLEKMTEQLLAEGENEAAAHVLASDYMKATQFVYKRGANPYWMMNTPGRLLGQYGTWPSYFGELMRNTMLRGSVENRMKVATRWAATNYAMYEVAKEAFGVDASRWLFFSPLGYTGGPFVQIGMDAAQAFNQQVNGTKDPAATLAASRLKGAWTQFVPGVPIGGIRHTFQALDAISNEDPATALKRFLGMPPASQ